MKNKKTRINIYCILLDNLLVDILSKLGFKININEEYKKPADFSREKYSTIRKNWYKKKLYRKYGIVYSLEDILQF